MFPVGYRCAVGMGRFGVASDFGYSGKCLFLPDDLTTVLINAVYLPIVLLLIVYRFTITIYAFL